MLLPYVVEVLEAVQRWTGMMGHDPVSFVEQLELDVENPDFARRKLKAAKKALDIVTGHSHRLLPNREVVLGGALQIGRSSLVASQAAPSM